MVLDENASFPALLQIRMPADFPVRIVMQPFPVQKGLEYVRYKRTTLPQAEPRVHSQRAAKFLLRPVSRSARNGEPYRETADPEHL